ncbi:MAG: PspC domain-containing protein [Anaerolineaceae bacterium]|nr:PspC domain-containing protein [Anaerolineaceae bacterium]
MDTSKRLYRSVVNRQLGGVCGGLADYFNIDPTLMRVLFILGLFLGTFTFWLYLVLWIVIPEPN